MADGGTITIEVKADTKNFDKQIENLKRKIDDIETKLSKPKEFGLNTNDIEELEVKLEKAKNQLYVLYQQKEKFNQDGFNETNLDLNNISNSVSNIIKKVGKWALAVFSVRSAYNMIRQASSTLAQYNEQYATNLEYIRYALAQALAPLLEYIVNLAYKLLAYINYIAQAWFGVNLFANASADSFKKAKDNLSGANKSAKELQKTLLGFDEMNILNSTSTGGGGGVGALLPTWDLSNLESIEIPDWVKWIANNKETIIDVLAGIAVGFLAIKAIGLAVDISNLVSAFSKLANGIGVLGTMLVSAGITVALVGIGVAIKGIIDFINHPSWSNFKEILHGIEIALAGVAVAMIAFNSTNPLGWIILAVDGVVLLTEKIIDLTGAFEDENDEEIEAISIEERLYEAREKLYNITNNYINAVENAENAERELQEAQEQTGINIDDLLEKMQEENLTYIDLDENQRKVYKAYSNNLSAQEKLLKSTQELTRAEEVNQEAIFYVIKQLELATHNSNEYKEAIIDLYEKGQMKAEDASMAIMYAMEEMDEDTKKIFTKDLPENIRQGLNPDKYKGWASSFKNWWNNNFINGLVTSINLLANVSASKGFASGGYVTKLATGGLVNLPSKGVPVTQAVAGEARNRTE